MRQRYSVSHEGRNMKDGCPWGWSIIDNGWETGPIVDFWGLTKRGALKLAREMNEEVVQITRVKQGVIL